MSSQQEQEGVAIHRRGKGRGIAPILEQEVVANIPKPPVVPVIAQIPHINAINSNLFISI
jgi:hypothetical protein